MKKNNGLDIADLRQKAEEFVKHESSITSEYISKAEAILIHEVQVHQIELEMQNDELMRANERAEVALDKYIYLYDFAPTGYFTLSKTGVILELNLNGAKKLGNDRSHLKNSKFGLFVSEKTKPIFYEFLEKVFQSETKESCEIMLMQDGNLRISVQVVGIVDENGENCHLNVVDITEKKKAEDEVREKDILFRKLLINVPDLIYQITRRPDGTFFVPIASEGIINIFGCTPEAVRDDFTPVARVLYPEDTVSVMSDIEYSANHLTDLNCEFRVQIPGKPIHWILTRATPEKMANGNITWFGFSADITERRIADEVIKTKNEELQNVNAEKDKFFSIIAHDLRGPLGNFLGLTQIMAEELPTLTIDDLHKISEAMSNSAANIYHLLENLLNWSLVHQGLFTLEPMVYALLPITIESIEPVLQTAKNKGVEISYIVPEDLQVFADKNTLQTVIRNLVTNAVKFTHTGGKIDISASTHDDKSVEISIKDTGIGMDQNILDNLFRMDVNTSRKGTEGELCTGLGLLLCKEFVEKQNGKLWVESQEGKGSTFYFTVPRAE